MNTERRVGLFFLISVVVICLLIMKTGQFEFFKQGGTYPLQATLDSAAGLNKDADVRLAGVRIGQVEGVRLEGSSAVVDMAIRQGVELPVGSRVKVVAKGILGDKYVEIVPAENTGQLYAGGERLESDKAVSVDDIMSILYAVGEDVKAITETLKNTVGTDKGETQIANILENIERLTADLRDITGRNKEGFNNSVSNIESFTADLKREIPILAEKLDRLATNLDAVVLENRENLRETIANARSGTAKLDKTLNSIDSIAGKIDRGEGTVGKLVNDEQTHDNLNKTLISFRNTMDSANDYLTVFRDTGVYLGFRTEYMFDIEESKSYFSVDIVPSETRFYQVDIVDSPYGRVKESTFDHVITDPDGTVRDQYTETIVSNKDDIKFSALIGQRFGDFVVKVGLIESKGGFGIGYNPPSLNKVSVFLEASDFSRENDLSPRMKLYGSYQFYRDFYLVGGVDDLLESEHSQYFLGVGIRFRDDFFKNLLSNVSFQ